MCGINGFISKKNLGVEKLESMNALIHHRGPDEGGIFHEVNQGMTFGMGMRRLSIIDLGSGKQPMYSDDLQKIIVFNGEIYNYQNIKASLQNEGVQFKTTSDTEVLLKLYEKKGTAAFADLDGMFAFSIYDKTLNKVFIARDFFGEKPLYYLANASEIIWCSELKSIIDCLDFQPTIDKKALELYFQLTYIPAPFTIYNGIHKLEPNHFIAIDGATLEYTLNEIPQHKETIAQNSKSHHVKEVRDLVTESVLSRSIADVPLGTFLSGGVDSSIVSTVLAQHSSQKIDTFSIAFENKSFDESEKSRWVAQAIGSKHHEFRVAEKDLEKDIDAILLNFDEPFADSSALVTYLVSKMTREYVKVALTGDGGDEVFGGYNKYYMGLINSKYTQIVPRKFHEKGIVKIIENLLRSGVDDRGIRFKIKRLLKAIDYEGDFYYQIISLAFQSQELANLFAKDWEVQHALAYYKTQCKSKRFTLTDFRNIDQQISLEGDMLVKVDRSSMLASIECRAPFLNKKLWNYTQQLPEHYLLNQWDKKHILKEAFKNEFPKGFLNKTKKGFGVPVGDWLRTILKQELESYITDTFIQSQGLFQKDTIQKLVGDHLTGKSDNTFRVWTFFCFQKWYTTTYKKKLYG
jgi:asparagine synthase (glutamine-hydrolysing)